MDTLKAPAMSGLFFQFARRLGRGRVPARRIDAGRNPPPATLSEAALMALLVPCPKTMSVAARFRCGQN
jgi:hypothetical protein